VDPDLIRDLEAGATLVTPNRRLARDLLRRFAGAQLAAGRAAWRSADILPWGAWLQRALAEAWRDDPRLRALSAAQELALWQRLIESGRAPLLDVAAAARNASAAWQLQLAWHIELPRSALAMPEDTRTYLAWAQAFDTACRDGGWLAPARAPDALAARAHTGFRFHPHNSGAARWPSALVLVGFDQLSPQQGTLLDALRAAGTRVAIRAITPQAGTASRIACLTAQDEWIAVAQAVRRLLDAGAGRRIGVVVPDLALHRADVLRIFDQALDPGRILPASSRGPAQWKPGAPRGEPACNVSLGVPLAAFPLVHAALGVLRLAQGRLPLTEVGALLRSPFLAGAEHEFLRRALLDAQLRRRGRLELEPQGLLEAARGSASDDTHACRQLAARLEAWVPYAAQARALRQLPSDWSATFLALLSVLGWPGERSLDSAEYQTYAKWRDLVAGLAHLDPVLGRLRFGEALSWLARLCADTLFQPESEEAPVQILGTLESAGLQFDHLFVTGLHDEAWPEPARPSPFLPVALQRARGVPHASAEWELGFARRMTALWRGAAPQVTFTHPTRDADRLLRASPLLADLQAAAPPPAETGYAGQIRLAARLEEVSDGAAPPLPQGFEVQGGVAVFENQAACPFRAFAVHRLGAAALEQGHAGLDPGERGTLLHRALALLWGELESQDRLLALGDEARAAVLRAVDEAIGWMRRRRPDALSAAFAELERERLSRLLGQLLELERQRAPFRVLAREEPRALEVSGLRARGRVDRIDALADGGRVILDYKSGKAGAGQWLDARPDAPQLPLYAVTDPGPVAAAAFVVLRPDEIAFKGLAAGPGLLPGAVPPDAPQTWRSMLAAWRQVLDSLAAEFLAGHAPVAPKRYPRTCEYCQLGPLCRVQELFDRGPVSLEDGEGPDGEGPDGAGAGWRERGWRR